MKNNISYKKPKKLSGWRKTSMFSWRPTGDSSCYAFEDIPVKPVIDYCKKSGIKLNVFIIKALSETLKEKPQINSTIRFWRIYPRDENVIFFHVIRSAENEDLSGVLFREAHSKSLNNIQHQYNKDIYDYKNGEGNFIASKRIQQATPTFITPILMTLYAFFAYNLNINLNIFKMPKSAFGSIMLTAIGQFGIQEALTPIAPYTRVPMVVSIGRIYKKLELQNNELTESEYIKFGFTFDHRIMDGIHFAEFLEVFKSKFNINELQ